MDKFDENSQFMKDQETLDRLRAQLILTENPKEAPELREQSHEICASQIQLLISQLSSPILPIPDKKKLLFLLVKKCKETAKYDLKYEFALNYLDMLLNACE